MPAAVAAIAAIARRKFLLVAIPCRDSLSRSGMALATRIPKMGPATSACQISKAESNRARGLGKRHC